jgi:hypothetical protein
MPLFNAFTTGISHYLIRNGYNMGTYFPFVFICGREWSFLTISNIISYEYISTYFKISGKDGRTG